MRPARSPAVRRVPRASSSTEEMPASSDTNRACHTPTPNAANDRYSRPVNTGAMYIGFQASIDHTPHSARLRALCTQAPSSCQTIPTNGFQGASAVGKTTRSTTATAPIARRASRKRLFASKPDIETFRAARLPVVRAEPLGQRRGGQEVMRRVVDIGRPVVQLQRDDARARAFEIGEHSR